ncbi:SNF2 domain-containing protein CLASSY 4-like isoform X1 [Arachis ipaensis]|uniref:SNF2 domain-containing protein CLASSY 4-like isoform X1 n=1 Tax=Arachis ipaensis TaxID=130454 RepID=UPI000A2AF060|nr:SNF2 domain-containing protein CLASSY 4-like isoform X1 [Arachis ipaensis]
MVIVNGVASRTRSKKKERSLNPSPCIGSGSRTLSSSSSKSSERKKGKRKAEVDVEVVEFDYEAFHERWMMEPQQPLEMPPPRDVIELSDDSDDNAAAEGLQKLHRGYVNEEKKEEVQERNVFPIDGAGTSANDPIIVGLSDSSSSDEGSEGGGRSLDWDFGLSSESEDTDNSDDEDFRVEDEGEGSASASASASTSASSSDDSGSSSFDDEDEEEEKEKRRCKRRKKEKKRREPTFESHSNKVLRCDEVIVETECSGICKKNGENKNNSSSTENNVFDHQPEKMLPKDADCASVLFGERNTEGCSSEKNEDKEKNVAKKPVEVCSSKKNEDKEENVAKKPVEGCSSKKNADCASVLFGDRNTEGCSSEKNEDKEAKKPAEGCSSKKNEDKEKNVAKKPVEGCSSKNNEDKEKNVAKKPVEGCSSKKNEDKGKKVAKKPMPAGNRARKRVERTGENVGADIEASSQKRSRPSTPEENDSEKDEKKPVKQKGRESVSDFVAKDKGDSPMIDERVPMNDERMESAEEERENKKEGEAEGKHKAGAVCESSYKEREQHRVTTNPSRPKEAPLIELLAECFRIKHNPDNVHKQDTISKEPALDVQRKFFFGKKVPIEKTESEKERDMLWEEMDSLLRLGEVDSLVGCVETVETQQNTEAPATNCKHKFVHDEETGIYCILCHWMIIDIKGMPVPFVSEYPREGSRKKLLSDGPNGLCFDDAPFGVREGGYCNKEGTVWDLIPADTKQNLYAHQLEGFEFLWKNLAGTMELPKLKSCDSNSTGGCIISHAPGTGKTRLTIVFLQTYLKVFPDCHPMIIAPASLLLTWEDEFRKWDNEIPFHNLSNQDTSGKEHRAAWSKVGGSAPSQEDIRMVKLYSWFKEPSILGISYSLFQRLTGLKRDKSLKENAARGVMGKILLEVPGLLVLDEGHTPRNQSSQIWKVLSEIQTHKRIILSGTPFQNNFLELYNTICVVRPSFPDTIPPELKKFCQRRLMQEKKESKGLSWEPVSSVRTENLNDENIKQLKQLMDPFVHVHKGSILQKNLPGLKDCVVTLMPGDLQKTLLEGIEGHPNTLPFDSKSALVSVHPSLFLCCTLSPKERALVDMEQLKDLKLNPTVGVKTRFLVEFVRICDAMNEKVLVFSQFLDPLTLIMEQLKSIFNWTEKKEVFYMSGKLDKNQRQLLIHSFNDPNSQAKILLASTKACCEGISLVGASRVVLLDVVWNPSVERQAISRAYRLGQKKVVYTYHLITHGTTEYTKYCHQAKKDRLSELVFSAKNTEQDEPKSSAVEFEDEILDNMVRHGKLRDLFGDCVVQPKDSDLIDNLDPKIS